MTIFKASGNTTVVKDVSMILQIGKIVKSAIKSNSLVVMLNAPVDFLGLISCMASVTSSTDISAMIELS